jgi:nicotinate phosphoribosyltransferase
MAYGYWKEGLAGHEAVFHHIYRTNPFGGGYVIACGLRALTEHLRDFRFTEEETAYLGTLEGSDGSPLFERDFLKALERMELGVAVDAVPEGTVVFPQEPLVRVRGPVMQAQLLETAVLNFVNFQSLVATKAARVAQAARGAPVLEFGLRRAHGPDGGLGASYAAYVGGCAATSNVLAGRVFGIPVKGTVAHSWIMLFGEDRAAFEAWARAMPNNCILLVDTYDSLEGIREAARVGQALSARGQQLDGIRLDSGDLAYLSREARRILDDAGLGETRIVASNALDEYLIESLRTKQRAAVDAWGVGTKLATAKEEPALDGVYKLAAVRAPEGAWEHRIKLSEAKAKISVPGLLQVRRFHRADAARADMIFDELAGAEPASRTLVDPFDETRRSDISPGCATEDLLLPLLREGRVVRDVPGPEAAQARAREGLDRFHEGIRRFENPHEYPVGLEESLHDRRERLIRQQRRRHDI